jgi:uncharacterized protein
MTNSSSVTAIRSTIDFPLSEAMGSVLRVDTGSAWVQVTDDAVLNRVSIGSLVAVQSSSPSIFLIGMLDRVTRSWGEEEGFDPESASAELVMLDTEKNLLRVVLLGTYSQIAKADARAFKRGADSYPHLDAQTWVIEGDSLQTLMGLLSAGVPEDRQLKLGRFVSDGKSSAIADGDRWFQRHAAILGSTGSGKSWSVALMLERASALEHPNLIVLDMHGEYSPLCETNDSQTAIAQGFRIAGPSDYESGPTQGVIYLPWWLLTQEELFALVLDRSEDNAPNQASRFSQHIRDLKAASLKDFGQDDLLGQFTLDSPIYCDIEKVIELLRVDDELMVPGAQNREKQGPFHGKMTRFISRLESRVADRRYGFMFHPDASTLKFEWLEDLATTLLGSSPGIKIVDFSQVPSDILPVVVGVFARLLYQVQFWMEESARTPLTLVCDEAHLYLPADESRLAEQRALDAFEKIAKEGRKYGVSLLVVSQRPSDVSRTVLSQCNNFMVLRLTNDQDRAVVQRLVPDSLSGLTAALPLLDIGEAIVLGDSFVLPSRMRLDEPTIKPTSATRNFWHEWDSSAPDPQSISQAVYNLRRQSRA